MYDAPTRTIVLTVTVVGVVLLSLGLSTSVNASTTSVEFDSSDQERLESDREVHSQHAFTSPSQPVSVAEGVDESTLPLQSEQQPHLVALIGLVVLVFLGGTLVIRNRLGERTNGHTEGQSIGEDTYMTDRERIRSLVTDNGGRMKQADIVDSVDWSKAKVSRLLADLESEDEITKLRLGRENLICLRGHEPPASKSTEGHSK